jgi:hypothetical protein
VSRRGHTVAGTSAKKNRVLRRRRRIEDDRVRQLGPVEEPDVLVAPERLEEVARRRREEAAGGR